MGRAVASMKSYPTIAVSVVLVLTLIAISIWAMVSMPLSEAVNLWNGGLDVWRYTPQNAQPVWTNWFRKEKLPKTITLHASDADTIVNILNETSQRETTVLTFNYTTTRLPNELVFFYNVAYDSKIPMLTLTWIKPDGTEIEITRRTARGGFSRIEMDLVETMGSAASLQDEPRAQLGEYSLRIELLRFEPESYGIEAKLIVYGGVYGLAGTDLQRRDLMIGLMWGTPIALLIGMLAAVGTSVFAFVVSAIGAWFGGWIDASIQRITEVSMMIPFLPTILMIGWFYSRSIWVMLGFIILFSLFSSQQKSYRATFLQVIHSQYIEAARAYGASNSRIVFRYLIPRMLPLLLPRLVLGIPQFVFLEASLALLGIADPKLPTWGKVLADAREALYMGHYHCVLEPALMLLLTGLSFSMLGYALDRIFNPKLRDS